MKQRTLIGRLLSPAGFGLVLLFFLLPFLSVSCGPSDQRAVGTFTGIDMVVGGEPDLIAPTTDEEAQEAQRTIVTIFQDQLDVEPLAILAALMILLGMTAALVRERMTRHALGGGLAVLATALLSTSVYRASHRIDEALRALIADQPDVADFDIRIRYGFWVCVAVLGALTVGHAMALFLAWKAPPVPAEPTGDGPYVEVRGGDPPYRGVEPSDVEVRAVEPPDVQARRGDPIV